METKLGHSVLSEDSDKDLSMLWLIGFWIGRKDRKDWKEKVEPEMCRFSFAHG